LGDFVATAIIYSETERTVLHDRRDGWASGRLRRTGEPVVEVLVQELPKSQLSDFREFGAYGGVGWSIRSTWWS